MAIAGAVVGAIFSEEYPKLRIIITNPRTHEILVLQSGKMVKLR